jgi:hypothetical protein
MNAIMSEVVSISETSVNIYKTTRCGIPKDRYIYKLTSPWEPEISSPCSLLRTSDQVSHSYTKIAVLLLFIVLYYLTTFSQ